MSCWTVQSEFFGTYKLNVLTWLGLLLHEFLPVLIFIFFLFFFQAKRCKNNNEDEENCLKTLNNKKVAFSILFNSIPTFKSLRVTICCSVELTPYFLASKLNFCILESNYICLLFLCFYLCFFYSVHTLQRETLIQWCIKKLLRLKLYLPRQK